MNSIEHLQTLEAAEEMIGDLQFESAANLLEPMICLAPLARPLLLTALGKLSDYDRIVRCFSSPESAAEMIALLDALYESGKHDELKSKLDDCDYSDDPSVLQMKKHINARLSR